MHGEAFWGVTQHVSRRFRAKKRVSLSYPELTLFYLLMRIRKDSRGL